MPRPSLTEEIMGMVEQFALLRERNIRGVTRQRHREAIRTRLTALETELEGYRKEKEPRTATPDPYEYRITDGPRKLWDGEPDLAKEGWEEYQPWERFDYHEERYWRRLKVPVEHSSSLPCTSEYVNAQSGEPARTTDLGNPEE